MIKKILLATKNQHKRKEIEAFLLPLGIQVLSLDELCIDLPDEVENQPTYSENAKAKCCYIAGYSKLPILADDSGLEIPALEGKPGIFSARYTGTGIDQDNRNKILWEMKDLKDKQRDAYFVCFLCFFYENQYYFFEGISKGRILSYERGALGFGYDSLFECAIFHKTYAELTFQEKLSVSHRGAAMKKFQEWLQTEKIPKVGLEPTKGCPH